MYAPHSRGAFSFVLPQVVDVYYADESWMPTSHIMLTCTPYTVGTTQRKEVRPSEEYRLKPYRIDIDALFHWMHAHACSSEDTNVLG